MSLQRYGIRHQVIEFGLPSGRAYADPFNEITVDVLFIGPSGQEHRMPAYWAGEQEWRVRFAPPEVGTFHYRTLCSDESNADLHGQEGWLTVSSYEGDNALLRHGPLRVHREGQFLQHEDGTPFFWLGDTWWMGLCRRLSWPDDFQLLTADRVAKGFTVIQIVVGLYPDMPAFDERGRNEAGFPWEREYARINPAYFDMADLRIHWLVRQGLVPCIVGCWGYHLLWLGLERMKQHWRNLVARYGAYPVIWCLAGEGAMPYYLSEDKERDRAALKEGWTELSRYLRQIDPYGRPITIHPTDVGRDQVLDDRWLDIDMLQTGHSGLASLPNTVQKVRREVARRPAMPVVEGEVCYEGILEDSREEVQRIMFWACFLSGAKGFTYGANGIWQVNTAEQPYGPSPHGASWGDRPWSEAYRLPGSAQLGICKALLERYEWWRLQAHPEWIEPHADEGDYLNPYAAGISANEGETRIFYFPRALVPWRELPRLKGLDAARSYRAFFFDPKTGAQHALSTISGQETWPVPLPPVMQDWVLVLEG
ncbi:MAG: DUF4038 domain-containing protein [Chloroflexi bacterium]|nr:DUF4038 domain-containing protein [Chloroflexota bacterium]